RRIHLLLAYVADLELEVDRLRKQSQFVHHEVRETLKRIHLLCTDATNAGNALPPLGEIGQASQHLAEVVHDLQEPLGYHPAHDQVTREEQSTDHENQQLSQRAAVIADYVMHALGETGDCNWRNTMPQAQQRNQHEDAEQHKREMLNAL